MSDAKNTRKSGLDGLFNGIGDILNRLNDLAETGEKLSGTTRFRGGKEDLRGVFGFSVKVGVGGDKPKVEPFGNIRKDSYTGKSTVQEVREPMVDLFEEEDHILVVAEIPGVGRGDIQVDLVDDLITITAEKGEKKYRKEILLPVACARDKMTISCNNGILEVKCMY